MALVNPDGYARFGVRRASQPEVYSHRIVVHELHGPIPPGMEVDHVCRTRNCVNPLHLEVVTVAENRRRRVFEHKSHCPKGHPYSGPNLYVNPRTGTRHCRACTLVATRRWYERNVRRVSDAEAV